jgi:ketosteroid isomerase-like protein
MHAVRTSMFMFLVVAGCARPPAAAPSRQEVPMSDATRDRAAIDQTIHTVARGSDLHQWDAVTATFADQVELDYGAPERLSGAEIVARWRPLLSAFDATQHELSDLEITITGDEARAHSRFHASHLMRGAAGGEQWLLSGRYEHALQRTPAGWKITRMRMIPDQSSGNPALLELAKERAVRAGAATERDRNREVIRAFFRKLEAFDIDGFALLFAPDGRQLMPFSPDGFPTRLDGRAAVFEQYRALPQSFTSMKFPDLRIIDGLDPSPFIATFRGEIQLRAGGRYDNTYAGVFVIRDGQIAEYTEYFNPITLVRAFGVKLQDSFNVRP